MKRRFDRGPRASQYWSATFMADSTASEPLDEQTIGSKSAPHFVRSRWVSSSSGSLLKRYRYPHATCASWLAIAAFTSGLPWPMLNAAGPPYRLPLCHPTGYQQFRWTPA